MALKYRNAALVTSVVAGAIFAFASPYAEAAQYGYTIPSGLPTSSPQAAGDVALAYAETNSQYAGMLQTETHATGTFSRDDYKAVAFSNNAKGTMTTATNQSTGRIDPMRGSEQVMTVVLKNIKTGVSVKIMIKCGQIRPKIGKPVKTRTIKPSKKVRVNKTQTVEKIICPSGAAIPVKLKFNVSGWVRIKGKITVKSVAAQVSAYISGDVSLKLKATITAKCGPPPAQPEASAPPAQVVQQVVVCGNANQQVGNGNAGSNAGSHCNEETTVVVIPPEPTCPDGGPIPPRGCDVSPQGDLLKPAHLMVRGTTYAYLKAYDPNGDQISATIEATGAATSGGTFQYSKYYDGLTNTWSDCPPQWMCFRAQLFAGNATGSVTLRATITAGGKTFLPLPLTFNVEPDAGWGNT